MRDYLLKTFLGILLLTPCAIQAQSQHLYFHRLSQYDGLLSQYNNFFYTDSRNLTWISSISGLNCYNGITIKKYTPDAKNPCSLEGAINTGRFFEDDATNIWFSVNEGLQCWNRKEDCFSYHPLIDPDGHIMDAENMLVAMNETLDFWILAGDSCLYKYNAETKVQEKFSPTKIYRSFDCMEGKSLRYLINFSKNKHLDIMTIQGGKLISEKKLNFSDCGTGYKVKDIYAIDYQGNNKAWLATDLGLIYLDLNNPKKCQLFRLPRLGTNFPEASSVARYTGDQLFVSSRFAGIYIFDISTKKFTCHFTANNNIHGLTNNDIRNVYYDGKGTLWAAYFQSGVSFANIFKNKFDIALDRSQLVHGIEGVYINHLVQDKKGTIWVGTKEEGIYAVSPNGSVHHYYMTPSDPTDRETAFSLFIDHGDTLWACQGNGFLSYYSPTNDRWIVLPGQPDALTKTNYDELITRNGDYLIVGTFGGLYAIKKRGNSFDFNNIDTLQTPKSYLYLFQSREGLLYACRNYESIEVFELVSGHWQLKKSLKIKGITGHMYESDATKKIYIATSLGLVILDENNFRFKTYNTANGLVDQEVQAVLEHKGILWLSTKSGLVRFDPEKEIFQTYTPADGLQGFEFMPAAGKLLDGRLVFGGANGANFFDPDKIEKIQTKPTINITGISINDTLWRSGRCVATGARNFDLFQKIRLNYSKNTISFDFVSVDYGDPLNNRVAYRLEGYDTRWDTLATASGKARYAQLREGTYTFQVIGANSDGVWNPEPRTIEVEILPPFYRTLWFRLLEILVLGGMIGGGVKLYVDGKLRAEKIKQDKLATLQKERDRIASEMHDDVGAGLTSIRLISDRIQRQVQDHQLQQQINRITLHAGDLIENMSSIIWAMNSNNDTYEGLFQYLRKYALEYLTETNDLSASFPLLDSFPALPISGERRRQIFLAFKESLHNIVKHAKAGSVTIQVVFDKDKMRILVADNGQGIPIDRKNGNGLINMAKRMEAIGGLFSVKENLPQGTIVQFDIPLSN
jgi:signal transduction histidine kinase/ligand-binding sensor domain-containing protein